MSTRLRIAPTLGLILTLAACGGSDGFGPGTGGADPGPGGYVPDELVGSWKYGVISPTNFWDDHTGQYSGNAYGIGAWFTFKANGTYEELVYIYSQQYSCRLQTWTAIKGKMDTDGNLIRLYPTSGNYKVSDTCTSSNNYTRSMTGAELADKQGETWDWQFAVNELDGKTYLYLGIGGGGYPFTAAN